MDKEEPYIEIQPGGKGKVRESIGDGCRKQSLAGRKGCPEAKLEYVASVDKKVKVSHPSTMLLHGPQSCHWE